MSIDSLLIVSEPALGPLINEVSRLMREEFDRRLRVAGVHLTRAQWRILYQLAQSQGATQSDLAQALDLERMTVSRHALRLESEGWLERRPVEEDGRIFRLYLRPKAERTLTKLEPVVEQLRRDYFSGIERDRRAALANDLLQVRDNLLALQSRL